MLKFRILIGFLMGFACTNTMSSDLDTRLLNSRMGYSEADIVSKPTALPSSEKPSISPTWQDPDTGLMWNKCPLGAKWYPERFESTGCDLIFRERYTWRDAILYIKNANIYGYKDWRMPTIQEFNTIYFGSDTNCVENKKVINLADKNAPFVFGCGKLKIQTDTLDGFYSDSTYWTSSLSSSSSENGVALIRSWDNDGRDGAEDRPKPSKFGTFMVRGGVSNGSFEHSVEVANLDLAKEKEMERELAETDRKRQELENQKRQKLRQAYNERIIQFQKKIKVGDYTNQGLVIGIKGQLIRVQQYGKQCVRYSPTINHYSRTHDCLKVEKIITGEAWVNRNELTPVP